MRARLAIIFATATTVTALSGPAVRRFLVNSQTLDKPNARSSHAVPTPRGGGIACVAGELGAVLTSEVCGLPVGRSWLLATSVLSAVGRVDDHVQLAAGPRLGAQAVLGAVVGGRAGSTKGALCGAFFLPVVVNAVNFMDGINGITGASALAWGLLVASDPIQTPDVRAEAALTAGMGAGFLPHNVPHASMFLGDVGSYLFGSAIGVAVLKSAIDKEGFNLSRGARALSPLVIYLADTGSTLSRRALRREKITEAHREHVYQQLVHQAGLPHWVVSAMASAGALLSGAIARSRVGIAGSLPVIVTYLALPQILWIFPSHKDRQVFRKCVGG